MSSDAGRPERVSIALPPRIAVTALLGGGALVALLVFVLIGIGRLNATLSNTNARLGATNERVDAIRGDVDPLAEDVPASLARIQPSVRGIGRDVDAVATGSLPAVEQSTRAIAEDVAAADLPRLAATLERLEPPLAETAVETRELLALIERLDLVQLTADGVRVLPRLDATVGDVAVTVHTVRDLLADTRLVLGNSLQVQCLTLRHLQSLDRKTGGPLPPDAQAASAPPAACAA